MNPGAPEISSQDKAHSGIGRLSLSDFGSETAGHWVSGRQRVAVEPGRDSYSVSFYEYDQFGDEVPGLLAFRRYENSVCEAAGVVNYPVDVGFDNLTSVGLDIENPGFDGLGGWNLHADGSLEAGIDRS